MSRYRFSGGRYRDRIQAQFNQACSRPASDKPKFEYLTEIEGVKIIMTDHAKKQCLQRHGMPLEQMKSFFEEMQDCWASVPVVEYNQEVFIYSNRYQRGMIVAYRRDFKNPDRDSLCLVVVTVYPYGKASPACKDTQSYRA